MKTVKKILGTMLALTFAFTPFACIPGAVTSQASAASKSYIRGDADNNGRVDIQDVTAIQRKIALINVSSFNSKAADVDGNGLNIIDATAIQRYIAGFENSTKIGETIKENYDLPIIFD